MSLNIEVVVGEPVKLTTAGKYCDRDIVVTGNGYTEADLQAKYDAGAKAEYDRFWDALQHSNEEYIHYGYMFACRDIWTQENIEKVKHKNLKANYVSVVFSNNTSITDLSMFRFEPELDQWGKKYKKIYSNTFGSCTNLEKCMEIDFDTIGSCPNMFNNCTSLVELPVIGTLTVSGLNLQYSTKLSHDSIVGIVNALSSTASGQSVTFSKTAVNAAFETSMGTADGSTSTEWTALANTKSNWTFNLV